MLRLRYFLASVFSIFLFSLFSLSTAQATEYEYAITGDGLFFYDIELSNWTFPDEDRLRCFESEQPIQDSAGGRGIIRQRCSDASSPYTKLRVQTYNVQSSDWSQCRIQSRETSGLILLCPKIFIDYAAEPQW
jgi:hypothetical protein